MIDQTKLDKLLDLIIEGVEKGSSLVSSEAPKIADEILRYESWLAMTDAIISGVSAVFLSAIVWWFMKKVKSDDWREGHMAGLIFGSIALFIVFSICAFNLKTMKQIEMAPKYYLIQKLKVAK